MAGSAPVEAEDELVEVGLQVLASEAVVDAQRCCHGNWLVSAAGCE